MRAEIIRMFAGGRSPLSSQVRRLAAFNLTLSLAWQLSVPVVPLLALETGASTFLVGLTVGASSVLPLLLGLPTGWLSDRFSTRGLQVMAAVVMTAAFALMLLARGISALALGQALIGLANMVASVAAHAFIGATTDGGEQDNAYGRYSFVVAIGNVAGPAIGGLYGEWAGPRNVLAIAFVFAAVALPQTLWLGSRSGTRRPRSTGRLDTLFDVLRPPVVRVSLIGSLLIMFGYSVKASFYVLYLDSIGFSAHTIGLLLAVSGAVTIAVRPLLARVTAGVGHARLLTLLCGAMGLGLAVVPILGTFLSVQTVAALLTGVAYGLSQPLTIAMIAKGTPDERLGLAFAWRQMAQRGGEMASPLLLGAIATAVGLEAVFWVAGGVLFVAAVRSSRSESPAR